MEYEINEKTVRILLPERISHENSGSVEDELNSIQVTDDIEEIVLDAGKLKYLSSVGLRILLRYKRSHPIKIRVIELSDEIYETFKVTGFYDLFETEKAYRYIETKGLKELGRGMYGAVYRIDDETVLKVFYGVNSREGFAKILKNIRSAFVKGIPTIIPFDTVKTENGYGMVFELINSESLADLIHQNNDDLEKYAGKMASLARTMATTEFETGSMESRNNMLKAELSTAQYLFTPEEYKKLLSYIEAVPERNTAVHGDFHARNVYMSDGEPLLIDMDDFCLGHPVWDIACLYRVYPYLYGLSDEEAEELFNLGGSIPYRDFYYQVMHLDFDEATRFWESFIGYYFEGLSKEEIADRMEAAVVYSDFMVIRFCIDQCRGIKDDPVKLENKLAFIRKIMKRMEEHDLSKIEDIMNLWK